MDGSMKRVRLINQLVSKFSIYMVGLLLLATPVLYLIITNYYSEDLIDLAQAAHIPQSQLDLERDTIIGLGFQILAMILILALSIFLILRLLPAKVWRPFYESLDKIGRFKVEDGNVPTFGETQIQEFAELNGTLHRILSQSVRSYQVQKQFTENASHELQTPLAIVQGKLDLLLQDQDLKEEQAILMQDIYHEVSQMSKLNRNLLLLAKIENAQFKLSHRINLVAKLEELLPSLAVLVNGIDIQTEFANRQLTVYCNEVLLESLIRNLIVNAVRHNLPHGTIMISVQADTLTVANSSDGKPLDEGRLFQRFYKQTGEKGGNGLGLAIVKSICDYHHWPISYTHQDGFHRFVVRFPSEN